jgi:hypothetical protein
MEAPSDVAINNTKEGAKKRHKKSLQGPPQRLTTIMAIIGR